jgi:hypothetical protein
MTSTVSFEGDAVRNLDEAASHDPVHDTDVLGEASTGGREARGAAYFFVGLALREGLLAAVVALAAGDVVVGHDTIADNKAFDTLADANDGAGHLVSEDTWGGVRAGVNLLEIGAADAAGVNLDKDFAGADLGDGDGFDTYIVDSPINGGTHGGRDVQGRFRYFRCE